MKSAIQLRDELRPHIAGERYTCFSEVSGLLTDIYEYLCAQIREQGEPAQPTATATPAPTASQETEEYLLKYDLYGLYDRAFEDVYAHFTLRVPSTWREKCPSQHEVELLKIEIDPEALPYLATLRTDIARLIVDIHNDFDADAIYEEMGEQMINDLQLSSDRLEDWHR